MGMPQSAARSLAASIVEMSYAADVRGRRYVSETALVNNIVSALMSDDIAPCQEPIGADGICHTCGWDTNTRSYRKIES